MQNKEKFINAMKDQTFLEKIIGLETIEEVQSAFKERDVDISIEELEDLKKQF